MDLRPGELIDIWVVEKALGSGGMGSVYRCHNRSAKRILAAIKVLDPALHRVAGAERRFIREAEILFGLDHPNIVKVRNIRIDATPPYLEMEFVQGESLERMLHRTALSWPRTHEILKQLTGAVAYLHGRGVRHRDIKPANVLVQEDGRVKLVDFGLAMEADQSRLTQANTTFGTVSYAPPEWAEPETLDPEKWDLYSIGVVTWEMLHGQIAFPVSGKGSARQQAMQVILAKQDHPALDPGPGFHDDLRTLVRELTAPDPAHRPASMAEVYQRVLELDSSPNVVTQDTLTPPSASDAVPSESTWVDGKKAMRTEWARALEATPIPSKGNRRGSEAATLITGETPVGAPARQWRSWGLVVGGLLAGAVGLALMTWALVLWRSHTPAEAPAGRAVDVVVTGLEAGTEVALTLDQQPERSRTSWVWRFGAIAPGPHTLAWAIGQGCATDGCPGDQCPSWCGTGTRTVQVEPGQDPQMVQVPLEPPPLRTVDVHLPANLGDRAVRVQLGELQRSDPGSVAHFQGIRPGPFDLAVDVGNCTEPDRGCQADGDCPPGCDSWATRVEVPWGKGSWPVQAAVHPPAPSPAPRPHEDAGTAKSGSAATPAAAPTSSRTAPAPAPTPAPGTAAKTPSPTGGAQVTTAGFASWLATHPTWQRDAAKAAGLADDGYLGGWQGAQPPAGATDQPVTGVSWYAASAYCRDHGGLAALDAPPLTWDDSGGLPYVEWRQQNGRAAWRSSDGRSSTKVRLNEANSFTGFRCAK